MNFPSDAEIREYCAYYIRAIKIFRETFKFTMGREPSESELQDFSKMGIIPFGILKQQNGNPNFQTPQISPQKLAQQSDQKQKSEQKQKLNIEPILEVLKNHPELRVEGERIIIKRKIEPRDTFHDVKDELEKKGWIYVEAKHKGVNEWEPAYFIYKGEDGEA